MLVGRLGKSARQRALINLSLCFPEYSDKEKENIVDAMFATASMAVVLMAELALSGLIKFRIVYAGMVWRLWRRWHRTMKRSFFLCHMPGSGYSRNADGCVGQKNGSDVS